MLYALEDLSALYNLAPWGSGGPVDGIAVKAFHVGIIDAPYGVRDVADEKSFP